MPANRSLARACAAAAALAMPLLTVPAANAVPADSGPAEPRVVTLTYDASGAAEFQQVVDQAAQIWNDAAANVELVPGTNADFDIVATDGWPQAISDGQGHGTIEFGREAVNQGYNTTRIGTHEMGHVLGLPDNRTGVCEDLMSGSSAPVDCANALPNPEELASVEENFAGAAGEETRAGDWKVYAELPARR